MPDIKPMLAVIFFVAQCSIADGFCPGQLVQRAAGMWGHRPSSVLDVWQRRPRSICIQRSFFPEAVMSVMSHELGDTDGSGIMGKQRQPVNHKIKLGKAHRERFLEETRARRARHEAARVALHRKIIDPSIPSETKQRLKCEHRFEHGRDASICRRCWSYASVCVCEMSPSPTALPPGLEVLVWVHAKEWGLASNTGSLLACTLAPCALLMQGLPQHEEELSRVLADPSVEAFVLWPGHAGRGGARECDEDERQEVVSVGHVQDRMKARQEQGGKVLIIAVDGTWRSAGKMVRRLPALPRLDLDVTDIFQSNRKPTEEEPRSTHEGPGRESKGKSERGAAGEGQSLLSPLRKLHRGSKRNVCTSQAVVTALRGLGVPSETCDHVVAVTCAKVERTRQYRGKPPPGPDQGT